MSGTKTAPDTEGQKIKKAAGAQSKIALANIEPVEAPPEKAAGNGRKSVMRDIADALAQLENQGKWFKVGSGKRTSAYQMRKRLQTLLPGIQVEVRGTDAENADVYATYTAA